MSFALLFYSISNSQSYIEGDSFRLFLNDYNLRRLDYRVSPDGRMTAAIGREKVFFISNKYGRVVKTIDIEDKFKREINKEFGKFKKVYFDWENLNLELIDNEDDLIQFPKVILFENDYRIRDKENEAEKKIFDILLSKIKEYGYSHHLINFDPINFDNNSDGDYILGVVKNDDKVNELIEYLRPFPFVFRDNVFKDSLILSSKYDRFRLRKSSFNKKLLAKYFSNIFYTKNGYLYSIDFEGTSNDRYILIPVFRKRNKDTNEYLPKEVFVFGHDLKLIKRYEEKNGLDTHDFLRTLRYSGLHSNYIAYYNVDLDYRLNYFSPCLKLYDVSKLSFPIKSNYNIYNFEEYYTPPFKNEYVYSNLIRSDSINKMNFFSTNLKGFDIDNLFGISADSLLNEVEEINGIIQTEDEERTKFIFLYHADSKKITAGINYESNLDYNTVIQSESRERFSRIDIESKEGLAYDDKNKIIYSFDLNDGYHKKKLKYNVEKIHQYFRDNSTLYTNHKAHGNLSVDLSFKIDSIDHNSRFNIKSNPTYSAYLDSLNLTKMPDINTNLNYHVILKLKSNKETNKSLYDLSILNISQSFMSSIDSLKVKIKPFNNDSVKISINNRRDIKLPLYENFNLSDILYDYKNEVDKYVRYPRSYTGDISLMIKTIDSIKYNLKNITFNSSYQSPIFAFSNQKVPKYLFWDTGDKNYTQEIKGYNFSYFTLRKTLLIDVEKNRVIGEFPSFKVLKPVFSADFKVLLMPVSYSHYEIIDLLGLDENGMSKKIGDYYYFSENDWYVVTPEGFYDKGDFTKDDLYYVYNDKEVYDLDQFQSSYRIFNLLDKLKAGKRPTELYPGVLPIKEQIKNLPPLIDYEIRNDSIVGRIKKRAGGSNNVFLNIAGRDVFPLKPDFKKYSTANIGISLMDFEDYYTHDQYNTVYVRATNDNNTIKTNGPKLKYNYNPNRNISNKADNNIVYNPYPKLYAVFMGIDDYEENQLDFAVNDAEKMQDYMELINTEWIQRVDTLPYKPYIRVLTDSSVTRANIKKEFDYIKENARAQDIVMLFFSGHGIAADALRKPQSGNSNFYYITKDFDKYNKSSFRDLDIDADLISPQALSSDELKEFLSNADLFPQKKILVMDACYSGQILEEEYSNSKSSKNDLTDEQRKALQDLNDKTGTVVITASRSDAKAYEADKYQHSFLTWGLIRALMEDYSDFDDLLNVSQWLLKTKNIVETQIDSKVTQRPSIDLNKDVDFQLGVVNSEIQEKIELPMPLPFMNKADINWDFASGVSLKPIAQEYTKELNRLLKSHSQQEDFNKRTFIFRNSEFASTGYNLTGTLFKERGRTMLKYIFTNGEEAVELQGTKCNQEDDNFVYCLEIKDFKSELPILVNSLINNIKATNQHEN